MPESHRPGDRSVAQRQADHAGLARLSESLVPALVSKLNAGGLGELEVREGDWHIRLRRGTAAPRRHERPRHAATVAAQAQAPASAAAAASSPTAAPGAASPAITATPASAEAAPAEVAHQEPALAPTVGVFKPGAAVGARVRAGDRVASVDLLGIPQDVAAPIDGVVVEIFAQEGDGVEYGEEVLLVEADAAPDPTPAGEG
jgi:biotin carboxyl carrier protein